MDGCIDLYCLYSNYTAVVPAFSHFSFKDLVNFVCERWKNLNAESINFTYGLPGHPKCMLCCDMDLRVMRRQLATAGVTSVNVRVSKNKRNMYEDINEDEVAEGSSCSNSNTSVCTELNPLSKYCRHEKKPLLTADWCSGLKAVGQGFEGGVKEFRQVLIKYSIGVGYDFKYIKNENYRVSARCENSKASGCKWFVHACLDKVNKWFYIKEFVPEHTCGSTFKKAKHGRISSSLVAKIIESEVRNNPNTIPGQIISKFKEDYSIDISYHHAWHGLEKAKGGLYGDHTLSFDLLRWYTVESMRTNPGSVFELDVDPKTKRFRRIFVAYEACISGFNHCRPMLFLDGTFLKSRYKGVLLSASAKDGNQGLLNVAHAVVDSETDDNWFWFITQLKGIVDNDRSITFISDRNNGLVKGIPKIFPNGYHAFCLFHLKLNLKDKCGKTPKKVKESIAYKFAECAYAPTVEDFEDCWEVFKKEAGEDRANDFVKNMPLENWANAFFKGKRYGEMTSNLAESFNSMILPCRHLPIVEMLDWIRRKLMEHMSQRRDACVKWNSFLCHEMDIRLEANISAAGSWKVLKSIDGVFEVFSNPSVYVNLVEETCSCFEWQLKCFPCSHAVSAILASKQNIGDFVDPYFHSFQYRQTYSRGIYLVPTIGKPTLKRKLACILPPIVKKQAGRPKKRRYDNRGEKSSDRMCSRCKKYAGHTKRTCNAPLND